MSLRKYRGLGGTRQKPKRINYSQLWLECAKRGISSDPIVHSALQQLSVNPSDIECARFVESEIHSADVKEILNPEPFRRSNPDSRKRVTGSIELGTVCHTGAMWGISAKALTEHMVICGRTGGGKSETIKLILKQLLRRA
ncbi:MAG: DUF87 domain-containing protein [candidate division Zixibacteria bacterium]|nr:DUF87 domain-containing protein [candidate division Zixibacteria bacterium]